MLKLNFISQISFLKNKTQEKKNNCTLLLKMNIEHSTLTK